jgi:hypothetical protein
MGEVLVAVAPKLTKRQTQVRLPIE